MRPRNRKLVFQQSADNSFTVNRLKIWVYVTVYCSSISLGIEMTFSIINSTYLAEAINSKSRDFLVLRLFKSLYWASLILFLASSISNWSPLGCLCQQGYNIVNIYRQCCCVTSTLKSSSDFANLLISGCRKKFIVVFIFRLARQQSYHDTMRSHCHFPVKSFSYFFVEI